MDKRYWNLKFFFLVCASLLFLAIPVLAKDSYSHLFVAITDASRAVKAGDQERARTYLNEIETAFEQEAQKESQAGRKVQENLDISGEITEEALTKLSSALLAFEKEQNPVDVDAEKKKLVSRLEPRFQVLEQAIASQDVEEVREAYKKMNGTWTINEGIVRDTSTAHYGKVETALSFLRSSIEAEPRDFGAIQSSFADLKAAIDSFVAGEELASSSSQLTLKDGIKLLDQALSQFQAGDKAAASASMKEFITIWPTIEGAVSTSNPALYSKVESESPVIMVKGQDPAYQEKLQDLITQLSQIDVTAQYTAFDAMLILLREGIEALLIVMALVTTLKAAKMKKGLRWVYSGALAGIVASFLIALLLQSAFPAVTSGANREILEGAVGIFAVFMMLFIGIWLHRKSSVQKWNAFMEEQMKTITKTGSFVSMFALSFLAVFREGAETILFYIGIIPRISQFDFVIGVVLALLILLGLAFALSKASRLFSPHRMFFVLTWMMYTLAFKMLGVSIHALQLTSILPSHLLSQVPSIDVIGLYPTWEGLGSQLVFVLVVAFVTLRQAGQDHE